MSLLGEVLIHHPQRPDKMMGGDILIEVISGTFSTNPVS